MSLQPISDYSFDDYLAAERELIDEKHEYIGGEVFAMAGGSFEHNLIVSNLIRGLGNSLGGSPCMALPSDMRVRIEATNAGTYPDIVVLCDPPIFHDDRRDTIINPTLLIEVLSPSTEGYDRGSKFALYRTLRSLKQYIMVAQDRISVDVYTREDSNRWLLTAYDQIDSNITFDTISCAVPMTEIYDRVPFDRT